jgi:hypothetical protein
MVISSSPYNDLIECGMSMGFDNQLIQQIIIVVLISDTDWLDKHASAVWRTATALHVSSCERTIRPPTASFLGEARGDGEKQIRAELSRK